MRNYSHKASKSGHTAYRTPSRFRVQKRMQVEIMKAQQRSTKPHDKKFGA